MSGGSKFRAACWNIHHGAPGEQLFANHDSLVDGVARLDADIVVLCEVDHRVWRSRFRHQAELVGRRLGYHALFAPARRLSPGWYGNALLSRSLPRRSEVLALPTRRGAENRSALLTDIPIGGRVVTVVGTHLQNAGRGGHGRAEAVAQLGVVLAALASRPGPAVLTGDLNLSDEHVLPAFERAGLTPVPTGATYPYPKPHRRIDWMGVRGLEVAESSAVDVYGSDHLAVVAELRIPEPATVPLPDDESPAVSGAADD